MKLSVVVIVYNITREAPRTLHSLSAAYQRNVDPDYYEVIVVENGSSQPLDPDMVRSLGPNFRYHYVENAKPSPAAAVNLGIEMAKGEIVGVMIDGARICTPGVLEHVLRANQLHRRAITAVVGYYLGEGYQRESIRRGYTKAIEDALLDEIDWPKDGYRLFEVGWADESSSFFQPLAESNALFMPKEMWSELGGMDERFDEPGGGFVNLDTLSRACDLPKTELVVVLGEATFHQVHGGVATNTPMEVFANVVQKWRDHYRELRGKEFENPKKLRRYIGTMPYVCLRHVSAEVNELLIPPSFAAERTFWKDKLAKAEAALADQARLTESAQAELERLQCELDMLQRSHSWLVTLPLRKAYRGVAALRTRLTRFTNGNGSE